MGKKGWAGLPGDVGTLGWPGLPGSVGTLGWPGRPGVVGALGWLGATGAFGALGEPGSLGWLGATGALGALGEPGAPGEPGKLDPALASVTMKVDRVLDAPARPRSLLSSVWMSASLSPNLRFSWDGSSRSICSVGDSWASARKNIRSWVDSIQSLHISYAGRCAGDPDLETKFPGEPAEGKQFPLAQH